MKKIFALIGLVSALPMHSCVRDDLANGGNDPSSTLSLTVNLSGLSTELPTRASVSPETGENGVNSLYLYFFEASENGSGILVDYLEVAGPLAMNSKLNLSIAGTGISVSDAYNIMAVANIDDNQYISEDVATWSTLWNGKTESYFRANALAEISGVTGETDNTKTIAPELILMNGSTEKAAMKGDISLTLTRNVSRFDVINNLKAAYDLVSVSIWNACTHSSITGEAVMDYSKTDGLRTARFYGLVNEDGDYKDMIGGLYAFENQVTSPAAADGYTTCLIVGLRDKVGGQTGYYRVNVHPKESAQNLRRNNVYRVAVTGVNGPGADSESAAYAGAKNELDFVINYWDMDNNGLIVSDMYSVLGLPVKTIRIGAAGGEFSYTVTAVSTLASPSPLAVKNQVYDPQTGKISASLNGSTITIRADEMAIGESDRTGIVTITFAGLETSVNIIQSSTIDTYLNVTLEDTWSSTLASTAGVSSENIYVKSSGAWTAQFFGDDGFSFDSNTGNPAKTTLTSAEAANGKFRIYTHSLNGGVKPRSAVVLITLDEDPVNFVSVVTVYQKVVGAININPDAETIVFNGSGGVISHSTGTFTVSSVGGSISTCSISGNDADRFSFTLPMGNSTETMTVATAGLNSSGSTYTATLRVTDSTGAEKIITLRQNSLSLTTTPASFGTIPVIGGRTELITVSTGDASSQWTATISTASTTSGKTLVNHSAYFVDENGNPLNTSTPQSVSQKFRVVFPKVYVPNREMNIVANVTIQIAGSTLNKTITINQAALNPNSVTIWNVRSTGSYGSLGNGYISGYTNALGYAYSQTSSTTTTYTHFGNGGVAANYDWTSVENFRTSKDGITMIVGDANGSEAVNALNSSSSPLKKSGFVVTGSGISSNNARLSTDITVTRIGQFLTTHGPTVLNPSNISSAFNMDATHTELTSLPSTAVPVMVNMSTARVIMAIDPVNKLVFLGESQVFQSNTYLTNYRNVFMDNYIQYVLNAARYGSHFTDMLREDLAGEIPALWDDYWGANKGVPSK